MNRSPTLGPRGDTLSGLLLMVCNSPSEYFRTRAARRIADFVKLQSKELSGELLVRLQEDLNNRILRLIKSPKVNDRLGAIETIDQLVSDHFNNDDDDGDSSVISNFAEHLLIVLQNPVEETLIPVTRALGHLSNAGTSAVSRTWVDKYMVLSFEWLRMDGRDNQIRRLTGIMVLKAICKNEQTVFYQHIQTCIRVLSSALFDHSLRVRVIATEVLAESLSLVLNRDDGSERHSRDVIKWFDTIFDAAVAGMKRGSDWSVHGSLMTFGEMLLSSGQYLSPKLSTVYDYVLEHRHRRDLNIRKCVLDLIPKLADYRPRYFIQTHMPICLKYVMKKCHSNTERGDAFLALGRIALAVGELIAPHMKDIMPLLQNALDVKHRKYFEPNALLCISMLARATPNSTLHKLDTEMPALLENMFSDGLVPKLIEALREIMDLCNERGSRTRPIRRAVQRLLMDEISNVLAGKPYQHPGKYLANQTLTKWRRKRSAGGGGQGGSEVENEEQKLSSSDGDGSKSSKAEEKFSLSEKVISSGETTPRKKSPKSSSKKKSTIGRTWSSMFGSFTMSSSSLSKIKESESTEISSQSGAVSSATPASPISPDHDRDLPLVMLALETLGSFPLPDLILLGFCRAHVLPFLTDRDSNLRRQAAITCTRLLLRPNIPVPSRSVSSALVSHTLQRLLEVAIGDPESSVRFAVIEALTPRFDEYLAQAQNLRVLFIALNDEVFRIRLAAIRVIARLTDLNPAYILPALRQTLIQILVELRYGSSPKPQEQGARLLTHLIEAAPGLVRPYLPAIIRALLPRLADKNVGVATAVLGTIEKVAATSVGRGAELMRHIEMLLPPIIKSLEDHSSARKRQVSLAALSRLIVCTGFVIDPFLRYPNLLKVVLDILRQGAVQPWPLRQEAMKLLGVVGALDPDHPDPKLRQILSRETYYKMSDSLRNPIFSVVAQGRGHSVLSNDTMFHLSGADNHHHHLLQEENAVIRGSRHSSNKNMMMPRSAASTVLDWKQKKQQHADEILLAANQKKGSLLLSNEQPQWEGELLPSMLPDEEYFPSVAIRALLRILRDNSLQRYHGEVVKAVMSIFVVLDVKCVRFLPRVVPAFLSLMTQCELGLRVQLFVQLERLVRIVKQHIRIYLDEIFNLMCLYWDDGMEQVLKLAENICVELKEQFNTYFPQLFPYMLRELTPSPRHRADVIKMQTVLKSLVVFGSSMDRFLYLLVPTLIRVIEMPSFVTAMRTQNALTTMTSATRNNMVSSGLVVSSREQSDKVKHAAIRALGKLAQELDFSDYASRIIHSLTRVVQRATATTNHRSVRNIGRTNTRMDTRNESNLPTAYSIFYDSGMLLHQNHQTASSSDSGTDTISNKERDALLALQALNTLCTLVEQLGSEYSALWVTLEKLISPPKSNRKKKMSSAFGSLQHHLHEKHQRWYKHLAAKILHHNRNFDAPYRRYESRGLVNLSSGSQDLESRNTASFSLGGFTRTKTSSDEGGFFNTNSSLNHGGSQSGLDTIIGGGGSSSFSSTKRRHTSEEFDKSVVRVDLKMNEKKLIQAFEASLRSTKEDWNEWIARISEQLLLESPSPALRACSQLHQLHRQLSRELFNAAFVSCWTDMGSQSKAKVLCALEIAFRSDTIPAEILQTLLKLAEFMEHDDKPLPINKSTLASLAEQCHAYAKALHYKEQEFQELLHQSSGKDEGVVLTDLSGIVESLISINSKLDQPEAAVGILKFAQLKYASLIDLQESWYEKLNRWEDALAGYERKLSADDVAASTSSSKTNDLKSNRSSLDNVLGMMRCLDVLMQWQKLQAIADDVWPRLDPSTRQHVAPTLALATWGLGKWEQMRRFTDLMDSSTAKASFYKAVIAIHDGRLEAARGHVNRSRMLIADGLTPLLAESYNRAYPSMVMVQNLAELDEIITLRKLVADGKNLEAEDYRYHLERTWRRRISGCQQSVDVWSRILQVRSLLVPPGQERNVAHHSRELGTQGTQKSVWVKFASLCRKSERFALSMKTLLQLGACSPSESNMPHMKRLLADASSVGVQMITLNRNSAPKPAVRYALYKHAWAVGSREEAVMLLDRFVTEMENKTAPGHDDINLRVRCHIKLGQYRMALAADQGRYMSRDQDFLPAALEDFDKARRMNANAYSAWHAWAKMNFDAAQYYQKQGKHNMCMKYVLPAVDGFFRSIGLARSSKQKQVMSNLLEDILRLLTLWFLFGTTSNTKATQKVHKAFQSGFESPEIGIGVWLQVTPQLIARIQTKNANIRKLLTRLLTRVGKTHPQALIYALTVASNSSQRLRKKAATQVLTEMRQNWGTLVDAAQIVSKELVRVAILWHEVWHGGLEEASRLYFGDKSISGMLDCLKPLHKLMNAGADTPSEKSFEREHGKELKEAEKCLKRFEELKDDDDEQKEEKEKQLSRAWDLYYHVFRYINKELQTMTHLELEVVSPKLLSAHDLELSVPGMYRAGQPVVRIAEFVSSIHVMGSKQRPRRMRIKGNDGRMYQFLLKGHEDLRQDERVMQLFGLINQLFRRDRDMNKRDDYIEQYGVIPLSHKVGVVQWVPDCDTLHQLIRENRETLKIPLNDEHRRMLQLAPDYDTLTLMQKLEVFEEALAKTKGDDIRRLLWIKSANSEVWLVRRTNYARSLAVMSMVGYILGLGDRHPSNLMLHRRTGKLVHIDFGDCFEVAQHREKYPEKIPFRLTRMLVEAMEVSGIEGHFRSVCENVMRVLREHRDSVMAMLETFVHDPLINWRLLTPTDAEHSSDVSAVSTYSGQSSVVDISKSTTRLRIPVKPKSSGVTVIIATSAPQTKISSMSSLNKKISLTSSNVVNNSSTNVKVKEEEDEQEEEEKKMKERVRLGVSVPKKIPKSVMNVSPEKREIQQNVAASLRNLKSLASLARSVRMNQRRRGSNNEEMMAQSIHANRGEKEREQQKNIGRAGQPAEEKLNKRAVEAIQRVREKLIGCDFEKDQGLSVEHQVERLIQQATSNVNLCQCYIGWCPFW